MGRLLFPARLRCPVLFFRIHRCVVFHHLPVETVIYLPVHPLRFGDIDAQDFDLQIMIPWRAGCLNFYSAIVVSKDKWRGASFSFSFLQVFALCRIVYYRSKRRKSRSRGKNTQYSVSMRRAGQVKSTLLFDGRGFKR